MRCINRIAGLGLIVLGLGVSQLWASELNDALWMEQSAEYKANVLTVYHGATQQLQGVLDNPGVSALVAQRANGEKAFKKLPPAIIMDVDETILNNYGMINEAALKGRSLTDEEWRGWIDAAKAPAMPGVVDFINAAKALDIKVFFVTNRGCSKNGLSCPELEHTIANLRGVGIKFASKENVMLKNEQPNWTGEKLSRFLEIAKNHRIVMMFGDNLGDFLPNVKQGSSLKARDDLIRKYASDWGRVWFMLPNPNYGSWRDVLEKPYSQYLSGKSGAEGSQPSKGKADA